MGSITVVSERRAHYYNVSVMMTVINVHDTYSGTFSTRGTIGSGVTLMSERNFLIDDIDIDIDSV